MKKRCLSSVTALILLTCLVLSGFGGKEAAPVPAAVDVIPPAPAEADVLPPPDHADILSSEDTVDSVPSEDAVSAGLEFAPARAETDVEMAVDVIPAEIDGVLSVIPEDAVGVIYIQSLLGLNDEINALLAEMIPSAPPREIIAKALAGVFGAGFETLEELEEIGLDLNKNFAVFLASVNPPVPSAAVHVKDPQSIKQMIEAESQVGSIVSYNGVTYYTTGEEGGFVFLDDIMVYSGAARTCEKAIDAYKRTVPSITDNADYHALKIDTTSGINDLVAYFAMEAVGPMLKEKIDELKAGMEAGEETSPQLAPSVGMFSKLLDIGTWMLDQTQTLSTTIQLNGSDLRISPFVKFRHGSEVQEFIHPTSMELTHLKYLPKMAFLNSGIRLRREDMVRLTAGMMKLFTPTTASESVEGIENLNQNLSKVVTHFYEFLGNEMACSANLTDSLLPDMLFIYDVTNAEKIKAYMEEDYLTFLKASDSLYQGMGLVDSSVLEGASAGPVEVYHGIEIKSYTLPNVTSAFTQLPPAMAALAPKQWNIYYIVEAGKLFVSSSGNAQPIKDALDRIEGTEAGFDQGAGYGKITNALTLKNNMLFGLSPLTGVKSIVELLAQTDPNVGMIMMLLANIPETYSIGIASQNREDGVEGQLFISLGDFKDLINMAVSMQGMR